MRKLVVVRWLLVGLSDRLTVKIDHANRLLFNRYSPFSMRERVGMLLSGAFNHDNVLSVINEHVRSDEETDLKFFEIGSLKIFFYLDSEQNNMFPLADLCDAASRNIFGSFAICDFFHKNVMASKGDTVFDIGANIGTVSLVLSQIVGEAGRVFAFEPVTVDVLQHNVKINKATNVEVIPSAVSNICGHTEIEIADRFLGSSITHEQSAHDRSPQLHMNVPVTTLDDFCARNKIDRVDFIKMNIEGAEEMALRGAKHTIMKDHPKWSVASNHIDHKGQRQHPALAKLLAANGYSIFQEPNQRIWASAPDSS